MPVRPPPITKITRPRIRGVFSRERLFGLLDETRKNPVTWISAPAGSGKTALVASFLEAQKIPCLWYQVDEGDADIATFFNYLGLAAKNAAPQKRKSLPLFTPEYLRGLSTFSLRYFENLFGRLKSPSILVLDNYQTVPAESDFHEVIHQGIRAIPEGINVFVISRYDLPPALVRLRINGLVKMLGWKDLRLTLEETTGIVPLKAQQIPSKDVIRQLHQTADGWVAGLVLMLEGMKKGVEPRLLGKMTPEEIIDYFGNEFFNKTDREIQDFLLKSSFLPKITVKAAEQLTGLSNANSILSALSRNNNFTERHYSTEPVYQFHPLYREFLMSRAREDFSQEALSTLLHQAAILLEQDGQTEAAISLFRDLKDWGEMVRLIIQRAPLMIKQGRYHTLKEWLDNLPKDFVEQDPWLLYWKGTSLFPFDLSGAQPYLEMAFDQFRVQKNLIGSLLAWSGVVESIFFMTHDFLKNDQWIQKFPTLPEDPEQVIAPEVWIPVVTSMFSALTNRHPDHSEIVKWTERAASIAQGPGSPLAKANILFHLVHWYLVIGDCEKSSKAVQVFQHLAQSEASLPFVFILTRLAEAMHFQITGDHKKCLASVSEGLKTSENSGIFSLYCSLLGHAISSCQNVGDLETAEALLEKMASSSNHPTLVDRGHYLFCHTRQLLLGSELDAASKEAELGLKAAMEFGLFSALGVTYLITAQVMHCIGKHREAWNHLHDAFRLTKRCQSTIWEYSGLMIEAYFHFEQGDEVSGLSSLQKALAIGKEMGYLNTYIDQPAVTAKLCMKALEEGIEVPYVQDIIRKRRLIPEKPPLHLENWPWPVKISVLGRFELLKDGHPVEFNRKVQKKPLLMLKAMIALGGKGIDEERLMDILWPEADGDQAYSVLTTTLSRLRRLLGENVLEVQAGRVSLNPRYCWVDVWTFEDLVDKAEDLWRKGHSGDDQARALKLMGQAVDLYQGPFLGDEGSRPFWALPLSERLKDRFLFLIEKLGRSLELKGQWGQAIALYRKGLEVDNLAEELYRRLMICYGSIGETVKAVQVYQQLKATLSSIMGIDPSPKTTTLYKTLTTHHKIHH
jgi:LuxR family transcriptional regulator, maltose regulon positive regulatory protein